MKTPLLLLGLALACALWAPAAEASTIFRAPTPLGLAQGLVGWWNFDGKTISGTRVFEASGNDSYGTMTSGPRLVNGKLGQGMEFDGSNDYVEIGDPSSVKITGDITISAWVYHNSAQTTEGRIVSKWDPSMQYVMTINDDDTLTCTTYDGTIDIAISTAAVTNNTWVHLSCVKNGSTITAHINGVAYGTVQGGPTTQSTSPLKIGAGRDTGSVLLPFQGQIDDVRVYNRALSADEIKRLYKIGATAKLGLAAANDSLAKGLVGWWTFDGKDVSGVQAYDKSGNGNRGILTNGPRLVNGKLGQGMSFDAVDDVVTVGDMSASGNAGSVSLWIRPSKAITSTTDSSGSITPIRIDPNAAIFLSGATVQLSDEIISVFTGDQPGRVGWCSSTDSISAAWHHIAVFHDGTTYEIYVDGVRKDNCTNGTNVGILRAYPKSSAARKVIQAHATWSNAR
jgi:hypothetical protein